MARKLGIEYFYKTKEERIENFHNKNTDILANGLINPYSNYKEINLNEYYKLIFGRNEDYLNSKFSDININKLDLPFEDKFGTSQIENNYVYNSILINLEKDNSQKNKNWIITKDLKELDNIKDKNFVITAPVTYVGRNRNGNNARYLYAFTIDLDYVGNEELQNLFFQIQNKFIPNPNIITNSGNGLHITYLLKHPYPLYRRSKELLNIEKEILTKAIWNRFTSRLESRQFQNILQGYRVPETKTKLGTTVTTFLNLNSKYLTIKEINDLLNQRKQFKFKDGIDNEIFIELEKIRLGLIETSTLKESKEKWPEWFQDRIVDKKPRKYMQYHEGLYNWWLNICRGEDEEKIVKEGHRYFCALALVSFATKCKIPKEQVRTDLYSLLSPFDEITKEEENHFLKGDIEDALKIYGTDKAYKFRREYIEKQCAINIPKNKRNGRTREEHLKLLHATNRFKKEMGMEIKRKTPVRQKPIQDKIREYLKNNPQNKPLKEIANELGISINTLQNNHNKIKREIEAEKMEDTNSLFLNTKELTLYNFLLEDPNINKKELSKKSGISYPTTLKYYDKIKNLIDRKI